tara:strand:+ start:29 stop:346 length:318 start_codon:yes stop_codon:yes gene_type:complete
MKITKETLKQIVKEEIKNMLEIEFKEPEIKAANLQDMRKKASEETRNKRGYKSSNYQVWTSDNPGESDKEQIANIRDQIKGMPGYALGYYKDGEQVFAYVKYNTF